MYAIVSAFRKGCIHMLDWLNKTWQLVCNFTEKTVTTTFPFLYVILLVMAGCFGSMLYGKIKSTYRRALLCALGIASVLMGASEIWDSFFVLQTGQFETDGTMLVIIALILGYVFGDALALDRGLGTLGVRLYRFFVKDPDTATPSKPSGGARSELNIEKKASNPPSAEGFMLATLMCACSGSTLRYALEYETATDPLPLIVKLIFGMAVFFVLASIYGSNAIFAAISVIAVEGILLLVNVVWGDLLTVTLLSQLALIGAVILISTGISLGLDKKVRAANFIPAFFVPVVYALIMLLVNKLMETE